MKGAEPSCSAGMFVNFEVKCLLMVVYVPAEWGMSGTELTEVEPGCLRWL